MPLDFLLNLDQDCLLALHKTVRRDDMRQRREDLTMLATAAQGQAKSMKELLRDYQVVGDDYDSGPEKGGRAGLLALMGVFKGRTG